MTILTYTFVDKRDKFERPLYHFTAEFLEDNELIQLQVFNLQSHLPQLIIKDVVELGEYLRFEEVLVKFDKCANCTEECPSYDSLIVNLDELNELTKLIKYAVRNFNHELEKFQQELLNDLNDDCDEDCDDIDSYFEFSNKIDEDDSKEDLPDLEQIFNKVSDILKHIADDNEKSLYKNIFK